MTGVDGGRGLFSEPTRVVAAIEPDSRPGVVRVRVGGRIEARISERDLVDLGIRLGAAWTEELARRAGEAQEAERARIEARRLLNARPRSRAELVGKVVAKGFDRPIAERVASELQRAGLIDDARLAASIIESVRARGGAGRALIERKLREREIDAEAVERTMAALLEDADPLGDAIALARKRAAGMSSGLGDAARARRLFGFLARKGFDEEVCERAVREVAGSFEPGAASDE